jgi:hypothetical protein
MYSERERERERERESSCVYVEKPRNDVWRSYDNAINELSSSDKSEGRWRLQ